MLIGISFGDNDFSSTICGFLKFISASTLVKEYTQEVTKERVLAIYKETIISIYILYQNCYVYSDNLETTKQWLLSRVSNTGRIYFDKEVPEYLENASLNSEFAYVDTATGEVYVC
jgi:hypothetical protein